MLDPLRMVEIGFKDIVHREAEAVGRLILSRRSIEAIRRGEVEKGDPLSAAEIAGILAAKKTSEIIPLSHLIPLTKVDLQFKLDDMCLEARCTATADYKTGVEMEALVGVTTALLTVWDMVKYLEKDKDGQYPETRIGDVEIVRKVKE